MKKYPILILLHITSLTSISLNSMEIQQGPMNANWFYDKTSHPFALANDDHQNRKWLSAALSYELKLLKRQILAPQIQEAMTGFEPNDILHKMFNSSLATLFTNIRVGTEYDNHMAQLNLAACLMAQRQATEHWASFDALLHIPQLQCISNNEILAFNDKIKTVLVRTDQVGIGDIFCFLSAVHELKNRTCWNIVLSVPNFLKETLACASDEYDFDIIGAKDICPTTDYETHLIALLGHLKLTPAQMNPEKVVFTAPERAMNAVAEQISPILINYHIAVVFLGENRQATLIGGKQLPRDTTQHGRHLDSKPFENLLKECPVTLIDCNTKNNKLIVNDMYKHRCISIAQEEQPFDTIIALARIMSAKKSIIAFGADTGPTNVFARSLDHDAQNRMAFIIPNSKEYDMRMEGEGSKYKHMISNCWVYKCKEPSEQTNVIEQAYLDMMKY